MLATTTAFDQPFQALITDAAWGHVWSRDTISLRIRRTGDAPSLPGKITVLATANGGIQA